MAVQNFTLPKPRNDDDWELWCKKIFASIYKLPDFHRFATRGRNQKGIDLFAKLDDGKVIVVQCKRRSTEKELTQKDAEADYRASLKLTPKPHHFIIATTHDKKGLQEWALNKTKPTADVYAWPDIEDRLATDESLRAALYGTVDLDAIRKTVAASTAKIRRTLAHTRKSVKSLRETLVDLPHAELSTFSERYAELVTDALDELDLFGVDLPKEARKYKLSVAYISLNLESGTGEQESGPKAAAAVLGGEMGSRLLIRGDAGGGKSTLLKWIAVQCRGYEWKNSGDAYQAEVVSGSPGWKWLKTNGGNWLASMLGQFKAMRIGSNIKANTTFVEVVPCEATSTLPWCLRVPFLIRLRDCSAGKLPAISEFAKRTANMLGTPPKGWEESVLTAGRAIVLLDGIDEVPPKHRVSLHAQIKALVKQFPDNTYVLTTRPLSEGEPDWLDELDFQQARIAPMSQFDRESCIDRWHEAVAEELQRSNRPEQRAALFPDRLKAALSDAPEIARLATNPLLCAMICALHRSKNHLPENLNELLEALSTILLYSREKETPEFDLKEFDPVYADLSYEDRKAIVSHLAKYMVTEGESALPRAMVKKKIGETLQSLKDRSPANADVVLKGLLERSGMLREKTASTIDFIHNTFKEYLAAVRFLDRSEIKMLARQAHEAGWDNVAVFAAAAAVRSPEFSDKLVAEMLPPDSTKGALAKRPRRVYKDTAAVDASDVKRYKRAVTAVRVASAIRTKLSADTQRRYEAMKKDLFPPRSLSDAAGLATAGNAVLKFVSLTPKLTPSQRVRCIRTLRLISTPEAHERLRSFRSERTVAVIEELAQAIDPLEIPAVVESFTETAQTAKEVDARSLEDREWRQNVRSAARSQIRTLTALRKLESLVELDLTETSIESTELIDFIVKSASAATLAVLKLARTRVTDTGVAALASKESTVKALTLLDLSETYVTDIGIAALAAKESSVRTLTSLDLSGTQVADAGIAAMATKESSIGKLTSLDLSETQVTDLGVAALAGKDTALKSLTKLRLGSTLTTDKGVALLAAKDTGVAGLTALHLGNTRITDDGLAILAAKDTGLGSLASLDVGATQITDVGLLALAARDSGLRCITNLYIGSTEIGDQGIKALTAADTSLKNLRSLYVWHTNITDVGLAAMAAKQTGISGLEVLYMWNTKITDAGLMALAQHNTGLGSLRILGVSGRQVTEAGIAAIRARLPQISVYH